MPYILTSGISLVMSSFRLMRPRSTHWRAAMAVVNFVHEASIRIVSRSMGF